MMKDGELMQMTGEITGGEELTNSAGVIARRGGTVCLSAHVQLINSFLQWLLGLLL